MRYLYRKEGLDERILKYVCLFECDVDLEYYDYYDWEYYSLYCNSCDLCGNLLDYI